MKVRHKQTGVVTEVIGFVPAHEYEIVRDEPVWRDVTEECETKVVTPCAKAGHLANENSVQHHGRILAHLICGGSYRLRKIKVNKFEGDATAVYAPMWAFIVEKVQS